MYTKADLDAAKAEFEQIEERWANDSSNNPDKYKAECKAARRQVREIEAALKATGEIASTENEVLERELDEAFPNAKSKEIVEYKGKRYIRRFFPLEKSRSRKTVTEWGKAWEEVTDY